MNSHITLQINNYLPPQAVSQALKQPPVPSPVPAPARQITCPAGTKAGDLLNIYGDLWQSKDVLIISQGRVILPDDILQQGMTLDILPLVDGG